MMTVARSFRLRRPATWNAGRLLARALIALALFTGVVFAHGGACAAMVLSEADVHPAHTSLAWQDAGCVHHELPENHRHGTEQELSAFSPDGASAPVVRMASTCIGSPWMAESPPAAPAEIALSSFLYREKLGVMRI
ncbi:hypothetical protein [Nonomuraea insulae]|uniref:Lipoprotein n=1 Tax=Nonomuraea insulae TaxID=1616787 RepID=A0ABW1C9S6_9ACTN